MTTDTTDTTVNDAPTGTAGNQEPAAGITGDAGNTTAQPVTFTTEQQAHIDKLVGERLERERKAQQAKIDKAKADAEAAQAAERGEWELLARKHEARAVELETELQQVKHDQQRRDAAQAAGIAQLWQRLQGSTPEELADDAKALAGMMQPAQATPGQPPRQPTQPTPAPQGRNGLTDEERRARATKTW